MERELYMWKYESYTVENGSDRAKKIGEAMRRDRKEARYTIRQLAEIIDVSPTHLNRMEKGLRIMDSIEKLIRFCDACHVPIDGYLSLCGLQYAGNNQDPIGRAFPQIRTSEQKDAINSFANIILSHDLSKEELEQILKNTMAYADFCSKSN